MTKLIKLLLVTHIEVLVNILVAPLLLCSPLMLLEDGPNTRAPPTHIWKTWVKLLVHHESDLEVGDV